LFYGIVDGVVHQVPPSTPGMAAISISPGYRGHRPRRIAAFITGMLAGLAPTICNAVKSRAKEASLAGTSPICPGSSAEGPASSILIATYFREECLTRRSPIAQWRQRIHFSGRTKGQR
jgi:hypothetical protein